jgi:hypothetical protein
MLRASEAICNYSVIELHIPHSWGLFQSVDTFYQPADISLTAIGRIAFRLAHVDFLLKTSIEERRLHI